MAGLETTVTHRVETADGLHLAVYEQGASDAPVVVLVHGYPDNHHVWDGVAHALEREFRVVRYDVRGAGRSDRPAGRSGYRIERLVDDLSRVIDTVSPVAPVHLVAHDWGSIQCWDALTADRLAVRIKSYTSVSGPSLDHAARWMRGMRSGAGRRLRQLLASYYIAVFLTPVVPEVLARRGVTTWFIALSGKLGHTGTEVAIGTQSRGLRDLINGIELYRANVPGRLIRPKPPEVTLPVLIITPTHDMHVSSALAVEGPKPFARDLRVRIVKGNHWVVAQRPSAVAAMIQQFIEQVTSPTRHPETRDSTR